MPAGNPAGYLSPEVIAQLTGFNVGPSGTPISPAMQDRMGTSLRQQDIYPNDQGLGADLLRRLIEVERTRKLDLARQQTGRSTSPSSWNPLQPILDVFGGG